MQRFESFLLAPAIILGTPAEAGLILTPRYSKRLYPKMLNGARKNLSNLSLSFVIYLRDTTLEVVSKPRIRLKSPAINRRDFTS
jgi:hypothetical protein